MATIAFTTTSTTFSLSVNGNNRGTWDKPTEVESDYDVDISNTQAVISLVDPAFSDIIKSTDTITVDGSPVAGATFKDKIATLKSGVFYKSGGASYKVYTALLSQTGTAAPVATVLENTTGGTGTLVKYGVGQYAIETDIPYVLNKGYIQGFGDNLDRSVYMTIILNGAIKGYYTCYFGNNGGNFYIEVDFLDETFTPKEMSQLFGAGSFCLPEIRLYP